MRYRDINELNASLKGVVDIGDARVKVLNKAAVRGDLLDKLIFNAVFNENTEILNESRWLIKAVALELGVKSASIQGLYDAMGRGEVRGFSVPAINIRGLSYEVARAVIRAALKNNSGAFIFEIARSEIGYTKQLPTEFAVVMIAAALKEGYEGPLFIQGDHFQATAKNISRTLQKRLKP
ncbi:MAG: hypothetical protein PH343_08640 [Nitrospira sp.]|nr:hypothetical protein [Nitrospira sp.]